MEWEAGKAEEQEKAKGKIEPLEEPCTFIIKETVTAFHELCLAMARFRKVDTNTSRFLEGQRGIDETLARYEEIYAN
jgi:hypothetical protein